MRAYVSLLSCWIALAIAGCHRAPTPAHLSDQEFWRVSEALSEPAGSFSLSENLLSNEPGLAENVRRLGTIGGVYVGVGPEQNFSYIARLQPTMAFIIDIRRENRNLHLWYKALFELSGDRAEFVSRLFSRPRPPGVAANATAAELFMRYDEVIPSDEQHRATAALVRARLLTARGLPLSAGDLAWIDHVSTAFLAAGPEIRFWGSQQVDAVEPSYRQLMTGTDATGVARSFLASERAFSIVKDLQARNLVVPVIGDFGGPGAIRAVGDYVRAHRDVIRAFYGSNVGVYLTTRQTRAFCASLASLPAAPGAWFIERDSVRSLASRLKGCAP